MALTHRRKQGHGYGGSGRTTFPPIVNTLAEELGVPPQIVQAVLACILGKGRCSWRQLLFGDTRRSLSGQWVFCKKTRGKQYNGLFKGVVAVGLLIVIVILPL